MSHFALAIIAPITTLVAFYFTNHDNAPVANIQQLKVNNTVACMPDRNTISLLLADAGDIPIMPGSGKYVWQINTQSDSAQLYFNQGINMYYGFHIIEAIASFKRAAKYDPSNPMIWWAQSLAAGPNINDIGYAASPEALETTAKAVELSGNASDVEKTLINAMTVRYSADSSKTREELNKEYVDAMKNAHIKFPDNPDVTALYADAMMLMHPWDLWKADGTPRPWEPLIQSTLEKALKKDPMHPGANHSYIHVMEPSPTPEKATASADILGTITPGLAHMVHMPSHIYLRTGSFNAGVENNKAAVKTFKEYAEIFPASTGNIFIYYWHNLHMLANSAMLEGNYNDAINSANELRDALDTASLSSPAPIGSYLYYMYMTSMMVNIQFEKWDSVLQTSQPDNKYIYANILYHFGQGMANASKKQISEAKKHANKMKELMKDSSLVLRMIPFSPVIEGSNVALELLNGSIALNANNNSQAVAHFKTAAEREWNIAYNEPRDWILNPYQYLGNAYLQAKNYEKAEEAFRKDLQRNAKNIWSQKGLEASTQMMKK